MRDLLRVRFRHLRISVRRLLPTTRTLLFSRTTFQKIQKAHSYPFPNGSSSDKGCGVNSSAPFSVMCMSSSMRTPNSPRI